MVLLRSNEHQVAYIQLTNKQLSTENSEAEKSSMKPGNTAWYAGVKQEPKVGICKFVQEQLKKL